MATSLDHLPPVKAKTGRNFAILQTLLADKSNLERASKFNEGILYYDADSPSVRERRATSRRDFESFCEAVLDDPSPRPQDMWNIDTIIDRTCDWLALYSPGLQGVLETKVRADTLYHMKEAIYWWAVRIIPRFDQIYSQWNAAVTASINRIGLELGLSISHHEKLNLGDAELSMFYRRIMTRKVGIANWKQHYAAWLMTFITSIRPGSITVCKGYGKGDLLPNAQPRLTDETLRWSDVDFIRFPDHGIGIKIEFKYSKGQRNPYTRSYMPGLRRFTLPPLASGQYEFDLSLILLAIGKSRGLFGARSIDELFKGAEMYIEKDSVIAKQPIFLASDQGNALLDDTAMKESALNPKLQDMCSEVGILDRNTMYSFRREALRDTKRKAGTELAREVGGHTPDSSTIYAYDHEPNADLDIVAMRFNTQGYTRDDLHSMFRQANTAVPVEDHATIQEIIDDKTNERLFEDEDYLSMESELQSLVKEAATMLKVSPNFVKTSIFTDGLRERSGDGPQRLLQQLEQKLEARKKLRRVLVKKYRDQVKEEMRKDNRKRTKVARQPETIGDEDIPLIEQQSIRDDETGLGNEDESRQSDPRWEAVPDDDTINLTLDVDSNKTATLDGRIKFVEDFAIMEIKKTTDLTCIQCQLDDTVDQSKRDKVYTSSKLNDHLKSNYHDYKSQLVRAFHIDKSEQGEVQCPHCNKTLNQDTFLRHMQHKHSESLTLDS